jgi:DNA repair exonuclease SbcCD ATPase subunit
MTVTSSSSAADADVAAVSNASATNVAGAAGKKRAAPSITENRPTAKKRKVSNASVDEEDEDGNEDEEDGKASTIANTSVEAAIPRERVQKIQLTDAQKEALLEYKKRAIATSTPVKWAKLSQTEFAGFNKTRLKSAAEKLYIDDRKLNARLDRQVWKLRKQVEATQEESEKKVTEADGKVAALTNSLEAIRKDAVVAQEVVAKKESEANEAQKEVARLKNDLADLRKSIKEADDRMDRHRSDVASANQQTASLSAELEKTRTQLTQTKDEEYQLKMESLKTEYEIKMAQFQQQLHTTAQEKENAEDLSEGLKKALLELNKKTKAYQAIKQTQSNHIEALQANLASMATTQAQLEETSKKLDLQRIANKEQVDRLLDKIQEQNDTMAYVCSVNALVKRTAYNLNERKGMKLPVNHDKKQLTMDMAAQCSIIADEYELCYFPDEAKASAIWTSKRHVILALKAWFDVRNKICHEEMFFAGLDHKTFKLRSVYAEKLLLDILYSHPKCSYNHTETYSVFHGI